MRRLVRERVGVWLRRYLPSELVCVPAVLLGGWATWMRLWRLRATPGGMRLNQALGLTHSEPPDA